VERDDRLARGRDARVELLAGARDALLRARGLDRAREALRPDFARPALAFDGFPLGGPPKVSAVGNAITAAMTIVNNTDLKVIRVAMACSPPNDLLSLGSLSSVNYCHRINNTTISTKRKQIPSIERKSCDLDSTLEGLYEVFYGRLTQ
jgi:hypothetical protein